MSQGIDQTKEALVAVAELLKEVQVLGGDGFQFTDIIAFIDKMNTDQAFATKLAKGLDGANLIAGELADLSLLEGLELIRMLPGLFKKP